MRISPELTPPRTSEDAYYYRAYGLGIRSTIEFPALPARGELPTNVTIRRKSVDGPMPEAGALRLIRFDAQGIYLAWPFFGRFRVESSGNIDVDSLPESEEHASLALLGPVLGAFLHQRGTALLHGSAVELDGEAILFLGPKGAGKSTFAAAMAAVGCAVMNDDIIPLQGRPEGCPLAIPGFSSLKLTLKDQQELLPGANVTASTDPAFNAKIMVSAQPSAECALPIGAVFILDGQSDRPGRTRLNPTDALGELLKQSYALKFGDKALDGAPGQSLFRRCAEIARHVPVWHTRTPPSLEHLRDFAQTIVLEQKSRPPA